MTILRIYRFPFAIVDWGIVVQVPNLIPDEMIFFNLPNPSSRTMALGFIRPLTGMITSNVPGR
jgi:hypothetical protein